MQSQRLPPSGRIAVVTVCYHSTAVLAGLAKDLANQSTPPEIWLLVDNSPDSAPLDTARLGDHPAVRRLAGREGDGFGTGCNRALLALEQERWDGWVWLLNPDTALPRGDELRRLRQRLVALPQRALVGTAVGDGGGGYEASGGWFDGGLDFRARRLDPSTVIAADGVQRDHDRPLAVDWLSGCSLALRPIAHQPGPRFDERFPLYYEDMDLCLRLGRQGIPVLWLNEPTIVHRKGTGSTASGPRRLKLSSLSYLRFLRRHLPGWVVALRSLRLLVLTLLRLPLRPRCSLAVLGAMLTVLWEPV
jgi:N-acetylglucosaminyl-diphospho-decaprenol L-rhamnosyltransferase